MIIIKPFQSKKNLKPPHGIKLANVQETICTQSIDVNS